MQTCPKCNSKNIYYQGLTYAANQQNPEKYLHKCKDCGAVFHLGEKVKDDESEQAQNELNNH